MDGKPILKKKKWVILGGKGESLKSKWMGLISEMKIKEVEKVLKGAHNAIETKLVKVDSTEEDVNDWLKKLDNNSADSVCSEKPKWEVDELIQNNELLKQDVEKLHKEVSNLRVEFDQMKKKMSKISSKRTTQTSNSQRMGDEERSISTKSAFEV